MTELSLPFALPRIRRGFKIRERIGGWAAKVLSPAKPVLKNLASIPLTVAGLGCISAGIFLASTIAGLIVTGVLLMVLEHMAANE